MQNVNKNIEFTNFEKFVVAINKLRKNKKIKELNFNGRFEIQNGQTKGHCSVHWQDEEDI